MIEALRHKFGLGQVEYSLHAVRQMVARNITPQEVTQTVLTGEVIEDYPNDKYGPSCLLFGRAAQQRPLHVQCTHPSRPLVKVITAYEPDPAEWDATLKQRKTK
ncbi:hypothetical protein LBMAG56_33970 [Verrucomicrobiota bacterium]|nr:hypothetical protein LBMAG56_33970 [Verrucomicrobiota bacterium]